METNKGAEVLEIQTPEEVEKISVHGIEMNTIISEKYTYGFELTRRDGTKHVMGGFHTRGAAERSATTYNLPWKIVRKKTVTMVSEWENLGER